MDLDETSDRKRSLAMGEHSPTLAAPDSIGQHPSTSDLSPGNDARPPAPGMQLVDWPFTQLELIAGLRRYLADPGLQVLNVIEEPIAIRLESTPVRGVGVDVVRCGHPEHYSYMLTQPAAARYGLPDAGRREAAFYKRMVLPRTFSVPELVTADPRGGWLLLEPYPSILAPGQWTADDYRQSVANLASFHDQFWKLDEDLAFYPWVAFPLTNDFDSICLTAAKAIETIIQNASVPVLYESIDYITAVASVLTQADKVAGVLREVPQTLLHGDYWPGNISVDEDGRYVVYDWQTVGVGPGILDLAAFITKSQLRYSPLPVEQEELIIFYRYVLANLIGFMWSNDEWQRLWDHALMWRFLQEKIIEWANPCAAHKVEDKQLLKTVWLDPVVQAADRWLQKYSLL